MRVAPGEVLAETSSWMTFTSDTSCQDLNACCFFFFFSIIVFFCWIFFGSGELPALGCLLPYIPRRLIPTPDGCCWYVPSPCPSAGSWGWWRCSLPCAFLLPWTSALCTWLLNAQSWPLPQQLDVEPEAVSLILGCFSVLTPCFYTLGSVEPGPRLHPHLRAGSSGPACDLEGGCGSTCFVRNRFLH